MGSQRSTLLATLSHVVGEAGRSSAAGGYKLLRFRDPNTELDFLIDTGAELSLVPPTWSERQQQQKNESHLVIATSANIASWGKRQIDIQIGDRNFAWNLLIADVTACARRRFSGGTWYCAHHSPNQFLAAESTPFLLVSLQLHLSTMFTLSSSDRPFLTSRRHQENGHHNAHFCLLWNYDEKFGKRFFIALSLTCRFSFKT